MGRFPVETLFSFYEAVRCKVQQQTGKTHCLYSYIMKQWNAHRHEYSASNKMGVQIDGGHSKTVQLSWFWQGSHILMPGGLNYCNELRGLIFVWVNKMAWAEFIVSHSLKVLYSRSWPTILISFGLAITTLWIDGLMVAFKNCSILQFVKI